MEEGSPSCICFTFRACYVIRQSNLDFFVTLPTSNAHHSWTLQVSDFHSTTTTVVQDQDNLKYNGTKVYSQIWHLKFAVKLFPVRIMQTFWPNIVLHSWCSEQLQTHVKRPISLNGDCLSNMCYQWSETMDVFCLGYIVFLEVLSKFRNFQSIKYKGNCHLGPLY